jgi:outer membrane protein insertion porin family
MLKIRKRLVIAALLCAGLPLTTFAQSDAFKVDQIKMAGLARIRPATVDHYLPIHKGQLLTNQKSVELIQDLYKTGFFSDVQLNRAGNTLWIIVKERPTVTSIAFSGNSAVTNKQLLKALTSSGITEGAFYDSSELHNIVEGLKQLYQSTGHNNAIINVKVHHANQNRIGLNIIINEGGVAKIQSLKIEGAHSFAQRELTRQLKMRPTSILEFLSSANKYSQQGLDNDIQALTNFYLDRGYLDFHVTGQHVTMTKDKKHVSIVFEVSEGQPYTISSIKIDNHSKMASSKIKSLMKVQEGSVFSRSKIMDTNTAVGDAFSDVGFAFPNISVSPAVNPKNHTVALTLEVMPGKHMTVRFIHFAGNNLTEDNTLRHELTFVEGSPYAQAKLNESRRRFNNFPFISNVAEKTVPVPGKNNQVDINYNVTEMEAGRAQIMGGYSDTDGFLYGVSLTEPNFKGQGKNVSVNLTRSQLSDSVSFSYFNPFYSIHNVGRGYELHYTKTNPNAQLNIASYDLDGFGGSLNYTVPMSNYLTLNYGVGYEQQRVMATGYTPLSIKYFINPNNPTGVGANTHSPSYHETNLTAGLSYVNTDRYYFPTTGANTSLNFKGGVPVISPNLSYYSASVKASWYRPLNHAHSWVLILHTDDSYGQGYGKTKYFPFMYNYYSGGIATVPGFSPNSLGPKDRWGNSLGGNEAVAFGFDVVFPNPLGHSVRTSITVNGGNVYNQFISSHPKFNPSGTSKDKDGGTMASISNSGPLRYSAGLRVQWQMPILGTIAFAVAKAINPQRGDDQSWFNFNFGTTF